MLVKALTSFAGKVSMYAGEIREIADDEIAKDLLNAGHIEEVKAKAEKPKVEEPKIEEPKAEPKKSSKRTKKK